MKLAVMQPYLFPYLGYWQLIANTDKFIFFDVVQYNKRSWMNRNRVLHFDDKKEFQYITVPVKKHEKGTLIKDILINDGEDYRSKILGNLTVYKRRSAPYYQEVLDLVDRVLKSSEHSLLGLSIFSVHEVFKYLGLSFEYDIASRIDFDRGVIEGPGDWALSICKSLSAGSYVNPPGGYDIFDEGKYKGNGVDLSFIRPRLTEYFQGNGERFLPGLSIIDVLMFNSPEDVRDILYNDFTFETKSDLMAFE